MKKILKYLGLAGLVFGLCLLGYGMFIVWDAEAYTNSTIFPDLRASKWRPFEGSECHFEVKVNDLPGSFTRILIKVQDPGFYSHHGIDLSTPGAGLTTITQAIVKKLYFKNFRSGFAKLKQSLIARFVVDKMISKNDQINIFLNSMSFGQINGIPQIGLQAAARGFFKKEAMNLSRDEFISLIATIISPKTFNLVEHPEWNTLRSERIKKLDGGEYIPVGLMDQYYGPLPKEIVEAGLPTCSYFPSLYEGK